MAQTIPELIASQACSKENLKSDLDLDLGFVKTDNVV